MKLDVWRFEIAPSAEKPAGLGGVRGERPATFALKALYVRGRARAEQALGLRMPAHHDNGVILQALADRQIDTDRDHQLGQVARRADPRKEQQLRRIVCTGGQDNLRLCVDLLKLAVADDFDAARPRPIEQNPGRERVRDDLQVWTAESGMEKGDGGAAAHAVALGELIEADAVLLLAVEVGIAGMARLHPRLHEGVHQRISRPPIADRQRAEFAVVLVLAALIGFRPAKVGQEIIVGPPLRALAR